ncbi:Neogenin [Symbioplanes lichenis]|uniref:Neogenin n=1 Tax=Symbioplanes lichenis TaxID=1629072 RepID=UPI002739D0D5|nr:Neogenin [Actinoplanes lichenis]
MNVRRLLTAVSATLVGVAATAVVSPVAALAAPAAPKSFSVARATDDVKKINVTWKAVSDADHYVVDVVAAGNVQSLINVPASTLSYTVDAPDITASYKVRIGAADAAGATASTGYWTVKSLVPSTASGLALNREDNGATAAITWKTPSWIGYTPMTAYHVVFSRNSDGVVLRDYRSLDTSFRLEGIDPALSYSISLTTENEYGAGTTIKSTLAKWVPSDASGLIVQRRSDDPNTVEVLWTEAASGVEPTYYQIGYGESKVTAITKVTAPATSGSIKLDTTKAWMVQVKAYNGNGGSNGITGTVPVWTAPAAPAATTPTTVTVDPTPAATTPAAATPVTAPTTAPGASPEETTTSTTVTTGNDRTPPTIKATLTPTPKSWIVAPTTISFACDDLVEMASCPADIKVDKDGAQQRFSGTAIDKAGNTTTITLTVNVDMTAPVITASVQGTKNDEGWYTSVPVIHYTCSDATSGVNLCPADTPVTKDGLGQKIIGTAYDKAGNTTPTPVTINLDQLAPVVTATVLGDANADGWYTVAPTIRYTCSDALSGVALCPDDKKVTTDGKLQTIVNTAKDKAGNAADVALKLNVDTKAPQITAEIKGERTADGWYTGEPLVHFTCTDEASGVAFCPSDQIVRLDGSDQTLIGTAKDVAGNTATASLTVNADKVAPTITATITGAEPNAEGWYRSAPTVHFTCADEGSGIASCPEDTTLTTEGVAKVIGTAVDKAGNTATAALTLNIDATAPEITATVVGDKTDDGWYRTAPVIHFECTDAGSGITGCPGDKTVLADGANQIVLGTATDAAGNTATASATVNLDSALPVIKATVLGEKSADGWYRTAPVVHFECTDGLAGIAVCPDDVKVTKDGADQRIARSVIDKAGNTAAAAVAVNVDQIAPEITATVTGTKNDAGWYRTNPTVRFTCTDNISTVASCPADVTVTTEGAKIAVPGKVTDKAGNTNEASVSLNIDKTAPKVSIAGAVNGTVYGMEALPVVSCLTTDDASGVATQAAMTHTSTDKGVHTVICKGAVDKAGNAANPLTITYTVEPTIAWLIQLTHQYAGDNATASVLGSLDTSLNKRWFLIYIAKVLALTVGKKPVISSAQATTLIYWAYVLDRKY